METAEQDGVTGFSYGGAGTGGFSGDSWRTCAASVTGPSHVADNKGCDDAAAALESGGWICAVVCDGAGSAPRGADGARMTAETIVKTVTGAVRAREPEVSLRKLITQSLEEARTRLVDEATSCGLEPRAFATTVVGALCRRGWGMFFQIGDGNGIALDQGGKAVAVSHGAEKEYANETTFLTSKSWREDLMFIGFARCEALVLMSDGVTPFALDIREPKTPFLDPIRKFLPQHPPQTAALAVARLLDRDEARKLVADDKTLLWAAALARP